MTGSPSPVPPSTLLGKAAAATRPWIERAVFVVTSGCIAFLVLLAAFAATGRFRVVPVGGAQGTDVNASKDALAMVEPVPSVQLAPGDVFLARAGGSKGVAFYRVGSIDSFTHKFTVKDRQGKTVTIQLGDKSWRLAHTIDHGGMVFSLLVGPVQSVILLLVGLALIVGAEIRRRPRGPRTPSPASGGPRAEPERDTSRLAGVTAVTTRLPRPRARAVARIGPGDGGHNARLRLRFPIL